MKNEIKINPLIKSSIFYFIATIIGQGMSFVSIIVFTRLMSQKDYGSYSTYYAYISIFIVFIGANLYVALNNAYIDKKETIHQFRKSVLMLSLFIMLGVSVLTWLLFCVIFKIFSTFVVVFAIFHSYAFFVVNYRIYSANMENDYRKKVWLLILPNTLQFFAALVFVLLIKEKTYEARIIGSTLGLLSVALFCFVEIIRCKGKIIDRENWHYALSISLPSTIMSISFMLMQQCDKVMITNICGSEETAVYSVIYYLGYAILAIDQAVSPVRQAWLFRQLDKRETDYAKTIQKWYLLLISFVATIVLMLGHLVLNVLAPETYWRYEYIVPFILSACMMSAYNFYMGIILFYKRNSMLSIGVLLCAIINILLNAVFIPRFGAVAACYTTVISYIILFVFSYYLAQRCSKETVYDVKLFLLYFVWITFMAIIYSLGNYSEYIKYGIYSVAIMCMIIYMINNREEIQMIIWKKNQ